MEEYGFIITFELGGCKNLDKYDRKRVLVAWYKRKYGGLIVGRIIVPEGSRRPNNTRLVSTADDHSRNEDSPNGPVRIRYPRIRHFNISLIKEVIAP